MSRMVNIGSEFYIDIYLIASHFNVVFYDRRTNFSVVIGHYKFEDPACVGDIHRE